MVKSRVSIAQLKVIVSMTLAMSRHFSYFNVLTVSVQLSTFTVPNVINANAIQ